MQDNTVSHKLSTKKVYIRVAIGQIRERKSQKRRIKVCAYLELCHAIHRFRQPKVRNFKFRWPILSKEYVLGLQVSVCDSLRMNVLIT